MGKRESKIVNDLLEGGEIILSSLSDKELVNIQSAIANRADVTEGSLRWAERNTLRKFSLLFKDEIKDRGLPVGESNDWPGPGDIIQFASHSTGRPTVTG